MDQEEHPKTLKVKYTGKGMKVVETPVPFLSKSEKTGQVVCNPIGVFEYDDAIQLVEVSGGMFELVDKVKEPLQTLEVPSDDGRIFCGCGCGGEIVPQPHHKYTGVPKYLQGHGQKKRSAEEKAKASSSKEEQVKVPSPVA